MNFKLFQIYFQRDQLKDIDPLLTPFDNTSNLRPELREYHSFKRILDEGHTSDLDAWGVFGPRWKDKIRYDAKEIFDTINSNSDHDVFLFNHARIQHALTYSVWEQGEYYHKGIKEVSSYVLTQLGYNPIVLDEFMTDSVVCYCSYFVAKKQFWLDYIDFLDKVYDELQKLPPEIDKVYKSSANYSRDSSLNLFPFIVERMFSTFILLHRDKYKVFAKPYDYSVYSSSLGPFTNVIASLNNLKTLTAKYGSQEIYNQWNTLRQYYMRIHPEIMNMD